MTQTQSWQTQVWSPDASKIVYHSDENGNWDIYTINIDGTEKKQLTTDGSDDRSAYFSPDGRKIVFVSNRSGNNDIWVMEGDGSNKVQLTTDSSDDIGPSWNPHGDKIAFMSDRSGNYDIWMMTLGNALDSDNDGLYDYLENAGCTETFDADTDDDGISDGAEDANKNGIVDPGETNPCQKDTDGDGIQDGTELGITEPIPDPDGDEPLLGTDTSIFITDKDPTTKTDPLDEDSDDDGVSDGVEDANQNGAIDTGETDPSNPSSYPAQTTIHLKKGFNLIGIACPEDGYTAFQFLYDLTSENVSSIQRYATEKGGFETAGFGPDGQPMGVDFPIVSCEGYFVFMKQEVVDFR